MSKSGAFVLPPGLRVNLEEEALYIHNTGDILIESPPEQPLHTLSSADGDVTLAPGGPVSLQAITAPNGTVTLAGNVTVDSVVAKHIRFENGLLKANALRALESVALAGTRVDVESVVAKQIRFENGRLKASVIRATESVALAGTRVDAHVVVAPEVEITGSVKGRATAISSRNELGPHKLKGGFSLSEFVDLLPIGREILERHGIEVPTEDDEDDEEVEEAPAPQEAEDGEADDDEESLANAEEAAASTDDIVDEEKTAASDAYEVELELVSEAPGEAIDEQAIDENEPPVADAEVGDLEEVEDGEDAGQMAAAMVEIHVEAPDPSDNYEKQPSIEVEIKDDAEEEEPAVADEEPPPAAADDDRPPQALDIPAEWETTWIKINRALEEIRGAYDGQVPPPIDEIATLLSTGALPDLKARINGIWSGLLKYHQRTKAYIPNTVTDMFQQIQLELRKI